MADFWVYIISSLHVDNVRGSCVYLARRMDSDGKHEKVGQALLGHYVCRSDQRKGLFVKLTKHRVACLTYFYDLLLHANWAGPSSGECPEFLEMPLPCSRELWQASTDKDWSRLYYAEHDINTTKKKMSLTFEHLFSSRRACMRGVIVASDLTNQISEWCEKADDLSVLLW